MVRVSVVVPVHNAANFLEATLRSLVSQTEPPGEIIVVDDGSTDGSADLVRRVAESSPVAILLLTNHSSEGVARSRNRGVAASSGEWVGLCDHDDLWHPQRLERLRWLSEREPAADAVGSSVIGFASNADRVGLRGHDRYGLVAVWLSETADETEKIVAAVGPLREKFQVGSRDGADFARDPGLLTTQLIYRRSAYLAAGGCASWSYLADDWMLNASIAVRRAIPVTDEPLVFYRVLPKSQSHSIRDSSVCILAAATALRLGGRQPSDQRVGDLYRHLLLAEARGRAPLKVVLGFALLAGYGPREVGALLRARVTAPRAP